MIITLVAITFAAPTFAQTVDFGDDSSTWSNDGECDDKRFEGPGMTTTPLLDEDIMADATDCRTAFDAGMLTLRGDTPTKTPTMSGGDIDFGDDSSTWSNDGECDDKRFEGPGMTTTALLDEDILADATDCRTAFEAGQLTLRK